MDNAANDQHGHSMADLLRLATAFVRAADAEAVQREGADPGAYAYPGSPYTDAVDEAEKRLEAAVNGLIDARIETFLTQRGLLPSVPAVPPADMD